MIAITKQISKYNHSANNNIQYIVIHSTGNTNDTAKNNADYFCNADRQASAHYFVDDNNIYQVVEESNASWHCGDGANKYGINNHNSIGIEMCGTNNGYISEKTIDNTIELVKSLQAKYKLSNDRVVRHYDASRKLCPYQFSKDNWARWNDFKARLSGNTKVTNTKAKVNTHLRAFQSAYNNSYDKNILVDGLWGTQSNNAVNSILLKQGSRNDLVAWVQIRISNKISVDGIFGNATKQAVMEYQKAHNLSVDGIVGANTLKTILKQYGVKF